MATPGCIWVQGNDLRYVAENGVIRRNYLAISDTVVSAVPGCLWIDTDGILCFINESGNRMYRCAGGDDGYISAVNGCLWIEGSYLYYSYNNEKRWISSANA